MMAYTYLRVGDWRGMMIMNSINLILKIDIIVYIATSDCAYTVFQVYMTDSTRSQKLLKEYC